MAGGARGSILVGLSVTVALACADPAQKMSDSARGAPPEQHDSVAASSNHDPSPASAPNSSPAHPPGASSPWPADTFDVRIDRWSFEEPAQQSKIPSCTAATPVITGDSIGPLRAGLTRAAVEATCPALHYGWYYSDDQSWTPAANVRLGAATVLIEFNGTAPSAQVTRVAAIDSATRTTDGLGAGASLADARRMLGTPILVPAKCAVFARWAARPGLIARLVLTDETGWECSSMRQLAERNALGRVPPDSRIGYFAQERARSP